MAVAAAACPHSGCLQDFWVLPTCGLSVVLKLQATCYLNKLPPSFAKEDRILVADCMLATGGTLLQARKSKEACCVACCTLAWDHTVDNCACPMHFFFVCKMVTLPSQVLDELISRGAAPEMIRVVRWGA